MTEDEETLFRHATVALEIIPESDAPMASTRAQVMSALKREYELGCAHGRRSSTYAAGLADGLHMAASELRGIRPTEEGVSLSVFLVRLDSLAKDALASTPAPRFYEGSAPPHGNDCGCAACRNFDD